jgi:hypothetical protein
MWLNTVYHARYWCVRRQLMSCKWHSHLLTPLQSHLEKGCRLQGATDINIVSCVQSDSGGLRFPIKTVWCVQILIILSFGVYTTFYYISLFQINNDYLRSIGTDGWSHFCILLHYSYCAHDRHLLALSHESPNSQTKAYRWVNIRGNISIIR